MATRSTRFNLLAVMFVALTLFQSLQVINTIGGLSALLQ